MGPKQLALADSQGIRTSFISKRQFYFVCKRLLDFAVALTALLFLLPVLAVIAVLIMLESRGPALFVQQRVGAKRRYSGGEESWEVVPFSVYKFRTMKPNCDEAVHKEFIRAFANGHIPADENQTEQFKLKEDSRITRVGSALRQTSLDELPQLINVLKGDMSLVGPRPVPVYEVEEYRPDQRARLSAWPGMTGLWQIKGRSRVSFDEMIRMDIEYIRNQSLWLDLKILLLTVPAVIIGRGAR